MKRLMTPDLTEKAAELYRGGLSTSEVGRRMGFHGETIRNALVAAKVQMRHGGEAQVGNKRAGLERRITALEERLGRMKRDLAQFRRVEATLQ